MSRQTNRPKIERTAEQRAEELKVREFHKQHPIRELPTDTIAGEDMLKLLKFVVAIRREREAQNLTLEQLAERAGMDAAALSRLETGKAFNPTISTIFRIAAALGKGLKLAFEDAVPPKTASAQSAELQKVAEQLQGLAAKVNVLAGTV